VAQRFSRRRRGAIVALAWQGGGLGGGRIREERSVWLAAVLIIFALRDSQQPIDFVEATLLPSSLLPSSDAMDCADERN